jgi:hypothetical protein
MRTSESHPHFVIVLLHDVGVHNGGIVTPCVIQCKYTIT